VEVQQSMILLAQPGGAHHRRCRLASYNLFDIEATAVFEWDGMRGLGWIERSARAGELGLG